MSHIREAIILAGGLGTRLRSAVPELPKCMAPVNGRPFISYLIHYLQESGVQKLVFSLGYRAAYFYDYLSTTLPSGIYTIIQEEEPLGTGGAIQLALQKISGTSTIIVNGDSIFKADLPAQIASHLSTNADCTLALTYKEQADRYGLVVCDTTGRIQAFGEKKTGTSGWINAGVYALKSAALLDAALPDKFSFETDFLQAKYQALSFYGCQQEGYFIDIGIPEDYQRAQQELTNENTP
ncbi:MAG TPA: nucleotidyltransferase family protein [Sediminibacterium sp.]|nr:nucleotidyltransferase family protein [Sediminibacterium sp.]